MRRTFVLTVAAAVFVSTFAVRAQQLPTPITEEAFDGIMKKVNPTFGEIRKAIAASDAAVIAKAGPTLSGLFGEAQKFFEARKTADAVGWAGEAMGHADALTKAAAGGDWAAAKEAASKIQPLCQSCHKTHRERDADGNYRIRKG